MKKNRTVTKNAQEAAEGASPAPDGKVPAPSAKARRAGQGMKKRGVSASASGREVVIIVPKQDKSTRFPGKNALLWRYTRRWLGRELRLLASHGYRAEVVLLLPPGKSLRGFRSLVNDGSDQRELIPAALRELGKPEETFFCIAQLTQPVRRCGLLLDALEKLKGAESRFFVTSCVCWPRGEWRWGLTDEGRRQVETRQDVAAQMDGALYAWQGNRCPVWSGVPSVMVLNYIGPVVDVDYAWQFNEQYIQGVQALAEQNFKIVL